MAFSSVPTITTGDVATASWGNTYIKNNFALTAPAVLTAQGDIVIASGANTPIRLAKDANPTRSLTNTGGSNAPAWAQVALATGVSGTLPVGSGGTGATSLTANGALIGNGTSAIASVDMSTKGGLLAGDGSGNPSVLAVGGTADHVLTVDSVETTGMKWAAAAGSLQSTIINGTRTGAAGSGSVSYSAVGFRPTTLIVHADLQDQPSMSIGFGDDAAAEAAETAFDNSGTSAYRRSTSTVIRAGNTSSGTYWEATLDSLDSDGFTLTWSETGSAGDISFSALCVR